jgi:excisionase family DNA binding protein
LLGVSRTTVYGLIRDGVLDAIKLRNRTLISRDQIVRLAGGNARTAAGDDDARTTA